MLTHGGSGDVDKAITRAEANHAAGVKTWMSSKLPYGWAQMASGWTEASVYIDKFAARAASLDVKAGIGEYGFSDEAFAWDKTWLDRFVASAKARKNLSRAE